MNGKNIFINDFISALPERFNAEDVRAISSALTIVLNDYDVTPAGRELVPFDNESEKLLKKFLATKRVEGRSEKTIERYRYILTRFREEMGIPFNEADVYALRLYLASMEKNGSSDNTINGVRSILSSFYGWIHNEGFIERNPAANLGAVKCRKVIRKPYSSVELELIKNACATLRDRALVEFLLSTGCRVDEVTNLNINDVNFITREATVLGKGNKERVVYLSEVCVLHLGKYLDARTDKSPALFLGKGGQRLQNGGVRAMLKRIEAETGVENVHPHRFRRTLATSLIDRGMTIQDVAAILGHANINTTTAYIYTNRDNVKANYKRFAS